MGSPSQFNQAIPEKEIQTEVTSTLLSLEITRDNNERNSNEIREPEDLVSFKVDALQIKASQHNGTFKVHDLPDRPNGLVRNGASDNSLIASSSTDEDSAAGVGLLPNGSGRRLVIDSEKNSSSKMSSHQWITVAILCFVNLINYMDRYTVAGILDEIQDHYQISDGEAGLLQTAFVVSYMVFAPVFGYLGDRYSRRYLMASGVFLWSLTTLIGSFMDSYGGFITFRALVGIGEASYSTIAPTIISDMFVDDRRSTMLTLFYFAIPVGSGLGYIVGAETSHFAQQWQWGLRVTPILGALAVVLIIAVLRDPARGESEHATLEATTYKEDVVYLCQNRSFMLSTLGFTCVAFVAGALAWWGPKFIYLGIKAMDANADVTTNDVSFKFGVIAMVSGLIGVPLGSFISQKLRERNGRADPLVCAFGLLASTPFLFFAAITARVNSYLCYTMIFFGEVLLNLNWSIVADILLYVVIPTRRSTAEAFQILLSHALGDAGSPYIIGQVSDWLKPVLGPSEGFEMSTSHLPNGTIMNNTVPTDSGPEDYLRDFTSLQYSLFITTFVEVIGGLFFLITAWYVVEDKLRADKAIAGDVLIKEGSEPNHVDAVHPSEVID